MSKNIKKKKKKRSRTIRFSMYKVQILHVRPLWLRLRKYSTCSGWLTWIWSRTVPLQDKLKQWPHAAPLQSGLAWTITSLCRPSNISLKHVCDRWPQLESHPFQFSGLFTECLHPAACDITRLWELRDALFEKTSRMKWKEPSGVYYNHTSRKTPPLVLSPEFSLHSGTLTGRC